MQRSVMKYLYDIQQACLAIINFTANKSKDDFIVDDLLSSAVERKFEIIGEAMRRIIDQMPDLATDISSASQIIKFRNRLIHGYDQIDYDTVWGVITDDLPRLLQEVNRLLGEDV